MASDPQIWMRNGWVGAKDTPTVWQYTRLTGCGEEKRMAKLIRCECGFVARGDSDDQVVGAIRDHMATDHPALLESVSQEDLLGWIRFE